MLQGYTWYKKEQAKEFAPILSCYALLLKDSSGDTCPGYYYNGKFYCLNTDLTNEVDQWMILQTGEQVKSNN